MKIRFTLRPAPTTWLSLLLLALLFPLGLSLPDWWSWENGPLENTQIIILGGGLLTTWLAADHNRHDRKVRNLWLWLTPFWLLCIGRELSWGQVFYPVSIGVHGPEFISIHQLWYGPLVKPLVAITIITMIIGCHSSPLKCLRQTTLPLLDIAILFLAAILSIWFDKSTISFLHPCEEVLEEWAELTAYWSMVSIVMITGFQKKSNSSLKRAKNLPTIHRL
jgi:hypothetical protein